MVAIDGFVSDLEGGDRDAVLVMREGRGATWIGLDAAAEPRWRASHDEARPLHRRWFVDGQQVRRLDAGGAVSDGVAVAALGAGGGAGRVLAVLDDAFLIARGHRVLLVDRDGHPRWPEARTLPGLPTSAVVSGGRVVVLTDSVEYTAWGYLGPAVLLRLRDGHPVATLRGARAAALDGERFLLGLEGYDVFDTWLHDRDGAVVQQWRSCGHLVPDPDDTVRVIEQDRTNPTRSRVVRLHLDGAIDRGPALDDAQASRPVVLDDGRAVFVDGGRLVAVDRALVHTVVAELVPMTPDEDWRFHAHVAQVADHVIVALSERLADELQPTMPGRTAADMRWRAHLFAITVT